MEWAAGAAAGFGNKVDKPENALLIYKMVQQALQSSCKLLRRKYPKNLKIFEDLKDFLEPMFLLLLLFTIPVSVTYIR